MNVLPASSIDNLCDCSPINAKHIGKRLVSSVSTNLRKNTDLNDLVGSQFRRRVIFTNQLCSITHSVVMIIHFCPRLQVVGIDAMLIQTLVPHNAVHRDFAVMVLIRKAVWFAHSPTAVASAIMELPVSIPILTRSPQPAVARPINLRHKPSERCVVHYLSIPCFLIVRFYNERQRNGQREREGGDQEP